MVAHILNPARPGFESACQNAGPARPGFKNMHFMPAWPGRPARHYNIKTQPGPDPG